MIDIKMKGLSVIGYLFIYLTSVFGEIPKVTYNGNQLWKITNDNITTLKILASLEKKKYLSIWGLNSSKIDTMINADFLDKVAEKLQKHRLKFDVIIDDIQNAINEENPKPDDLKEHKGYRLTWNYYHNLKDIYDYLHYLENIFPKLCKVRTIGQSFEGRPIKLLQISNKNPNNKAIFIEGGIHAREWISPSSVTYIINQFVNNYEKNTIIHNIDWYFVPVLNPDGYEYSYYVDRLWRKNRSKKSGNCIGVDLNRNFGYDWDKNGSSPNPCSDSYRGKKPFSEPETAAVANLFINNPDISWLGYIAIHSYGQFILYPWGSANTIVENHEELNRIGTEAAKNILINGGESYTVGPSGITIKSVSGISIDWARGSQAIKYVFDIKLRDRGRYGFILPAKLIKPTSEEAIIAIKTIVKNINAI